MTTPQALAFIRRHGIVLESARGPVPNFAAEVAGTPLRGTWWSHPKGKDIFRLSRALRESPQLLVCRLAGGKVTYVHRRLWPALVLMADHFPSKNLDAITEEHTATGRHRLRVIAFPRWVPDSVWKTARALKRAQARLRLAAVLG